MATKKGIHCAVRGCFSKQKEKNISFFRIPKDAERARQWLIKCNREDLIDKTPESLYLNYRICALHFEDRMYANELKNRLLPTALPTIFSFDKKLQQEQQKQQTAQKVEEPENPRLQILSDIMLRPADAAVPDIYTDSKPSTSKMADIITTESMRDEQQIAYETGVSILPTSEISKTPTREDSPPSKKMRPLSPLRSPTSTQTLMSLSANTPRKKKLRMKVKELRKRNIAMQTIVATKKPQVPEIEDFEKMCDQFLPESLAQFVKVQAHLNLKKPRGRRYSMAYKEFALTLYFLGPRAYHFLEKLFYLPSKRILQSMTHHIVYQAGLGNEVLYRSLKMKVDAMVPQDKHCILCIDEMSLKSNLFYHIGRDEIVGLCNVSAKSNTKEFRPACNATVIMARGLYNNWKQPIAYFFVYSTFPARELKIMLEEAVLKLTQVGLKIHAVLTDMGSNFIELRDLLGVTTENPEFSIHNQTMLYIFDTPHLLKATRNNLLRNEFHFDGKTTRWSYICQFYEKDKQQLNRLAPKLTDIHLSPNNFQKMKVKLATQVLSHTISSGMNTYIALGALPAEAMSTVEVIENFNNLFDMLNSSGGAAYTSYQSVFAGSQEQRDFLQNMKSFISRVSVLNSKGQDITSKTKCLTGWLITITAIEKLWDRLEAANFQFLMTRRVNQDCLENFFGSIRQQSGNCINPIPIQFERAFKKLFSQHYLHSDAANCSDDFSQILTQLKDLQCNIEEEEITMETSQTEIPTLPDCDYRTQTLPEQNAFVYVCGYLIRKTLTIHTCDICEQLRNVTEELDRNRLFAYFKNFTESASTYGPLYIPSEHFLHYIYQLETIFVSKFEEFCVKEHILKRYFALMTTVVFTHNCSQFPLAFLIKLFIRLRIFYGLKFANKNFIRAGKNQPSRKVIILSHL